MLAAMPLATTLSAAALLWVLRSPRGGLRWWAAGALLGLGVYSYTAYAGWLAIAAALLCCYAVLERDRTRRWGVGFAVLAVGFATAAWPMVQFAILDTDVFLHRYLVAGIPLGQPIDYWAERAWTALTLPIYHTGRDSGTGFGGYGAMGWALGPLAYIGFIICIRRWRSPPHLLLALAFAAGLGVLLPGIPDNGEYRRALLMVPFSFGMAGIAAVTVSRWAAPVFLSLPPAPRGKARMGVHPRGGGARRRGRGDWVYWADHKDIDIGGWRADMAALDAAHADDPGTIYWYSTSEQGLAKQLFLYPETRLVDRYGTLDRLDDGPVTYVLRREYAGLIDDLRELQPGGAVTEDEYGRFVIYRLPAR